jgi:hypothetical protein
LAVSIDYFVAQREGALMRKLFLAITLFGSMMVQSSPGVAAGAVALGVPPDIAKDGVASFVSIRATTEEAKKAALAGRKGMQISSKTSRSFCKIVATFENQCVATALDPKDGTPGFGWAMASNSAQAKKQAISNCRDTAGPARQDACIVGSKAIWCDGRAR